MSATLFAYKRVCQLKISSLAEETVCGQGYQS